MGRWVDIEDIPKGKPKFGGGTTSHGTVRVSSEAEDPYATLKDVGYQFARGAGKGALETLSAPYRLLDWIGEKTGGWDWTDIENRPEFGMGDLYKRATTVPEAETAYGRYAGRVGEFAGSALPIGGGMFGLSRLAPQMWGLKALGRTGAGRQALVEGTSAAGGGVAAQAAEEADLGPGWQLAAGIAGGMLAPTPALAALRAYRGLGDEGALFMGRRGRGPPPPAAGERVMPDWRPRNERGATTMGQFPEHLVPEEAAAARQLMPEDIKLGRQDIADEFARAGFTPEQLQNYQQRGEGAHLFWPSGYSAPRAEMLADIDPNVARLAGREMRLHSEASNMGQSRLTARQTGETPPIPLDTDFGLPTYPKGDPRLLAYRSGGAQGAEAAGQQERVAETLHRATITQDRMYHGHGRTAEETAANITANQKLTSNRNYGALRNAAEGVDLTQEKGLVDAVNTVVASMERPGLPKDEKGAIQMVLDQMAPRVGTGQNSYHSVSPHIDDLDKGKQFVNDRIGEAYRAGNYKIADRMEEARDTILEAADAIKTNKIGDLYSKARVEHRDQAELLRHLKLGEDLRKGTEGVGIEQYATLDRESKKLVRHGYIGQVLREMGGKSERQDVAKLFETTNQKRMLRDILDNTPGVPGERGEQAERFFEYLSRVGKEQPTRTTAYGGSQTAQNIADDKLRDVMHRLRDIAGEGLSGIPKRALEYTLQSLFGKNSRVSVSIVNDLTSANPLRNQQAMNQIIMLMGRGRAGRLADKLEQLNARYGQRATGAVHTSDRRLSEE